MNKLTRAIEAFVNVMKDKETGDNGIKSEGDVPATADIVSQGGGPESDSQEDSATVNPEMAEDASGGKDMPGAEDTSMTEDTSVAEDVSAAEKSADVAAPNGDDDIPLMDRPSVRVTTSLDLGSGGFVAGISMQGRSHIQDGTECQDYHYFEDLGEGWKLAIVSDGAGSAREAARGSKANCEITATMVKRLLEIKKWRETDHFPSEKEWHIEINNILETLQMVIIRQATMQADSYHKDLQEKASAIRAKIANADADEKSSLEKALANVGKSLGQPLEPRDFNATIILMLLTPKGMLTAHIGDGRMGYLTNDGEWKSLMTPHKGDEASSTVFVPSNWNRQYEIPAFTMKGAYLPDTSAVAEVPKAFVLMSDGCESFSWNCMAYDREKERYYDRNTPYEKFLDPLVDCLRKEADGLKRVNEMKDIINVGTTGGRREMDDRTLLLCVL